MSIYIIQCVAGLTKQLNCFLQAIDGKLFDSNESHYERSPAKFGVASPARDTVGEVF
jgi:hypothetical protein